MTAFYEAFLYDAITGRKEWVGTADLKTIEKFGLAADLRYPYYGEKTVDGWGYKVSGEHPDNGHDADAQTADTRHAPPFDPD